MGAYGHSRQAATLGPLENGGELAQLSLWKRFLYQREQDPFLVSDVLMQMIAEGV
jgi:hypothetical protein